MNIFVTCDGSMGMKYWTFITVSYHDTEQMFLLTKVCRKRCLSM